MIMTDMYDALKGAGLEVYLPGQAVGECRAPRILLADAGVIPHGRTLGRHVFYVTACVPFARPIEAAGTLERARAALQSVTSVRPTGETSEGETDDTTKAYCISAEYAAMCSLT